MRKLSLILLCLIIAVAANASDRKSKEEKKSEDRPASTRTIKPNNASTSPSNSQTSADRSYAPAPKVTVIQNTPAPSTTRVETPRPSYSQGSAPAHTNYYPGRETATSQRVINPEPRIQQAPQAPTYRPVIPSAPEAPKQISRPTPGTAISTHDSTGYRPGNTGYSPVNQPTPTPRITDSSSRRQEKIERKAENTRQAAQQSAYRPVTPVKPTDHVRPAGPVDRINGSSISQGNVSYKPGYHPAGNPPSGRPQTTVRPTEKKTFFGKTIKGQHYTIGYRPSKHYVPTGYKPPVYRRGHYYYPSPRFKKPCYYGYWAPSYNPGFSWRSVYFNFGLFPYVQVTRITECSYTSVSYISEPIYVSGGTFYSNPRYNHIDETLADIRSAWIGGRFDLIERHVRTGRTIAVILDGQYDYAISGEDYLSMTRDALGNLNTVSFVWDKVRERGNGTITAFGQHSYQSSEETRTVYVSYTLQRIGSQYFITEVGSSSSPLD